MSVSFLLICFLNGAASAGDGTKPASPSLQERVCRTIAAGSHPVVIVPALSGTVRGKLMKADTEGIAVLTSMGEVRVSWDEIAPKYLLRIAGKVLSDSAGDAEAIARYALEKHLAGEAEKLGPAVREALARSRAADQSSAQADGKSAGMQWGNVPAADLMGLLKKPRARDRTRKRQALRPRRNLCGVPHEDPRVPVQRARATGSVYYVARDGSGHFTSVQKALNAARPGDKVVVRPGVYRERVEFRRSGEPGRPIILEGEEGAILDGGDVMRGWEPAPEVGPGVFKKSDIPHVSWSMNMTWNNKYVLQLYEPKLGRETTFAALRMTEDSPPINAGGFHAGRSMTTTFNRRWDGIEAYFTIIDRKVTYVRFRDGQNPDDEDVTFAPLWRGVVHLDGKHHLVVRDLTIRNGWSAVMLDNGAADNVVEDNYLIGGHNTVRLWTGTARNHIRNNDITLGYVSEHLGITSTDDQELRSHIWHNFKDLSTSDRIGINLASAGDGNQIYGNHIFKHWGGIQDHFDSYHDKASNRGSRCRRLNVYHNVIHHIHDDGLEPNGAEIEAEWHDNLVFECGQNLRIKNCTKGPMYVYRNRFFHLNDRGYGLSIFVHQPGAQAETYVYHNTIAGYTGLAINPKDGDPALTGLPNGWFLNNIFSAYTSISIVNAPKGHRALRCFDCNYLYQRNPRRLNKDVMSYGTHNVEGRRLWTPPLDSTFMLTADSPVRGRGIDLSRPWTLDGVTHDPLPGMEPGYFSGAGPDLGAVQFGMPRQRGLRRDQQKKGSGL